MVDQMPPPARRLVDGYGDGGFRIGGERLHGSLLITSLAAWPWPVDDPAAATLASLEPILSAGSGIELLLFGSGPRMAPPMPALRAALRTRGVTLEMMATGAACRTFNLLVAEGRRVGAALIAV